MHTFWGLCFAGGIAGLGWLFYAEMKKQRGHGGEGGVIDEEYAPVMMQGDAYDKDGNVARSRRVITAGEQAKLEGVLARWVGVDGKEH